EFDKFVFAGITSREPDSAHASLGAAVDHPDQVDARIHLANAFGHFDFQQGGGSEGTGPFRTAFDRINNLFPCVSENHRPPGSDKVDIPVAIFVEKVAPLGFLDKARCSADTLEGTNRGVDAAGNALLRSFK